MCIGYFINDQKYNVINTKIYNTVSSIENLILSCILKFLNHLKFDIENILKQ